MHFNGSERKHAVLPLPKLCRARTSCPSHHAVNHRWRPATKRNKTQLFTRIFLKPVSTSFQCLIPALNPGMLFAHRLCIAFLSLILITACSTPQSIAVQDPAPAAPPVPTAPTTSPSARVATEPAARPTTISPTASSPPQPSATSASPPTPTPGLDSEPYATLGSPAAPITIYEFSDYGCTTCRQFALFTFEELKTEYIDTGKVYYIRKDYPVVSRQGGLAAQSAECAGEQGHYWEMHHQLFLNPAEWDTSPEGAQETFRSYAQTQGIDTEALAACVAEGRYKSEVDRDFEEGMDIGLFGVPIFIINRKLLSGAQPIEVFREVIERELVAN